MSSLVPTKQKKLDVLLEKPLIRTNTNFIRTHHRRLVFPDGVAVQELEAKEPRANKSGQTKEKVPIDVKTMLEKYGLAKEYNQLMHDVKKKGTDEDKQWSLENIQGVLNSHKRPFAEKGIGIFLSFKDEFVPHGPTGRHWEYYRWIEFVDHSILPNHTPPRYDKNPSNFIQLYSYKLEFPNGVAVQELEAKEYRVSKPGCHRTTKEKVPIDVKTMLEKHDLVEQYKALMDDINTKGTDSNEEWSTKTIQGVVDAHKLVFANNGVRIVLSQKEIHLGHGRTGRHWEHYRWIEFVDHSVNPNYVPGRPRESDGNSGGCCSIM